MAALALIFCLWLAPAVYAADSCATVFGGLAPASVADLRAQGFRLTVAKQIAQSEPLVADAVKSGRPLQLPRTQVTDVARGYRRSFDLSRMRSKSVKAVKLYRGLHIDARSLAELKSKLHFDSKQMTNGDFAHVGDVVWVSRDIDEANAYANRPADEAGEFFNVILEIQVPRFMYFERNSNEGFLLPEQFHSLKNFIVGVRVERTRYEWKKAYSFDPEPSLVATESDSVVLPAGDFTN